MGTCLSDQQSDTIVSADVLQQPQVLPSLWRFARHRRTLCIQHCRSLASLCLTGMEVDEAQQSMISDSQEEVLRDAAASTSMIEIFRLARPVHAGHYLTPSFVAYGCLARRVYFSHFRFVQAAKSVHKQRHCTT